MADRDQDILSEEETGAVGDFLEELDRETRQTEKTEGPSNDEDPDGLLTEGPDTDDEDEAGDPGADDEDETGAPLFAGLSGQLSAKFKAQLAALTAKLNAQAKAKGRAHYSPAQVAQLVMRTKQQAARKPQVRRPRIVLPNPRRPKPAIVRARKDTYQNYKRLFGKDTPVIVERGFYFSTGEFILRGEGVDDRAFLTAEATGPNAAAMTFFMEAIDEDSTRLGNPHKVTAADTNLRKSGRNSYPEQVFLIEEVEAEFRGLRVQYGDKDVQAASGSNVVKNALRGYSYVFDDHGRILPEQIFRDFDGVCELERALHSAGVLRFQRKIHDAGDNSDERKILVDTFRHVPVHGRRASIADTSGGASTLSRLGLKEAFHWALDQNNPDNGEFRAIVELLEDFVFPIIPVDLGGKTLAIPEKVGVYWEIRVHGTSIRKRNAALLALNRRR